MLELLSQSMRVAGTIVGSFYPASGTQVQIREDGEGASYTVLFARSNGMRAHVEDHIDGVVAG